MQVKIAQLKSQLSQYLRQVKQGQEVIVTDRETPIARVIPFEAKPTQLIIQAASKSPRSLAKMKFPPPPKGTDSLKALLKDREEN